MMSLIDIGANLTHSSFDNDLSIVIQNAHSAGISRIIVTGTSIVESVRALELSKSYPKYLFATAGVHPHNAKEFDEYTNSALRDLAKNDEIVAIGECGLDFHRNFSTQNEQKYAFLSQLELATEINLPVFLHQREAHKELVSLLKPIRNQLCGGVAHCFTGGKRELHTYLDMDLYIGITGWLCDDSRGHELRDAVSDIPLERLLLETDAPYLLPKDLPQKPTGRRNEPRFLPHILERLSKIMSKPVTDIADASRINAEQLFNLKTSETS